MRGCTHPEPTGCPYSCSFSYSTQKYFFFFLNAVGSCPFSPLEFVTQGAPEPRGALILAQGGASTENQFPDSPEWWVPTKNHPPSSHCAIACGQRNGRRYAMGGTAPPPHCFSVIGALWTEEAPLSRGRGCPPTALLLIRCILSATCFWTCQGIFGEVVGNRWLGSLSPRLL